MSSDENVVYIVETSSEEEEEENNGENNMEKVKETENDENNFHVKSSATQKIKGASSNTNSDENGHVMSHSESSSVSPRSSSSSPTSNGSGGCDGNMCSINPPSTPSTPSNSISSPPGVSCSGGVCSINSPPPSYSSNPSSSDCDGSVCSFNPSKPSSSFNSKPSNNFFRASKPTRNTWSPLPKEVDKPQEGYVDNVQNCVNDICTSVVQEVANQPEDCDFSIGGTCIRTEGIKLRFHKIFVASKESFITQFSIFHISLVMTFFRTIAEKLALLGTRKEGFLDFIKDLVYRVLISTMFLILTKIMYDIFVELMVQFCCGESVKNFIPRLDHIMMGITIFSAMRHCGEEGKIFCLLKGLKEVGKTLMIVYMTGQFGSVFGKYGVSDFLSNVYFEKSDILLPSLLGMFLATFIVNLLERIQIFLFGLIKLITHSNSKKIHVE